MPRRAKRDELEFEDLSSYSSARGASKASAAGNGHTAARVTLAVLFSLMLLAGLGLIWRSSVELGLLPAATAGPDASSANADEVIDSSEKHLAVFLVDGLDGSVSGEAQGIMVVSVDETRGKIKLTSFLPDAVVSVDGGDGRGDRSETLRAAYRAGGAELAVQSINRNFGMNVRDHLTVSLAGLSSVVKLFDGIEVRLTAEEVREINQNLKAFSQRGAVSAAVSPTGLTVTDADYILDTSGALNPDSGNYVGGVYPLDGNRAAAYCMILTSGGEALTAQRQQVVAAQLIKKLGEMNSSRYAGLFRSMMTHFETTMTLAELTELSAVLTGDWTMEATWVPDSAYETDLVSAVEAGGTALRFSVSSAAQRISSFLYEDRSPDWEQYRNTGRDADRDGIAAG